jgi:2-polyprenyl-3-methyl-5-hydroxy-6-metoxy-1,4-benzoquinol methylase
MIHYAQCPVCSNQQVHEVLAAIDHTVSQQRFSIWECDRCQCRYTQDVPDEHEIAPYYKADTYVSHTDTREGLVNKLYHRIRKITLRSKASLVCRQTGLQQGSILDIGAGTGAFLHTMQIKGWEVAGLEPDALAAKISEDKYGIKPLTTDHLFNLPKGKFHAITMWHVLEHVHRLHDYVKQLNHLLAENGVIFVAVPNHLSSDAAHYQSSWAAYDVPRHLYHFSPESMQLLMQQHGLQVIKMKQMWYDSFYVSMLSEQYKRGQTANISAFFNGLKSNLRAIGKPNRCSSVIYIIKRK